MAQRVVHEIAECLAQAQRIGIESQCAVCVDHDPATALRGAVGEALAHALEHRPCSEPLRAHRQLPPGATAIAVPLAPAAIAMTAPAVMNSLRLRNIASFRWGVTAMAAACPTEMRAA